MIRRFLFYLTSVETIFEKLSLIVWFKEQLKVGFVVTWNLGDCDWSLYISFFRRAYHILSYFMFYFNIFLGMVSCLLRIILGVILGVIFLSRLQKSSLPRSYERRDPGNLDSYFQKQLPRSILGKRCSENMQQIYRRAPMPKCDIICYKLTSWVSL